MKLTIRFILTLGLFKGSFLLSQCPATICNGAVYDCYITPPNPGCPFGSATWGIYIPWPPYGRIYTPQDVFVQNTNWNAGNPMVWHSSGLLPPGDYVVYFFNNENCCAPANACTTIPFTIPGPNLEGFISVSIDSGETEYPANRCSSGSVTASFSMNGQNCLPQPTATLVHNGGTIPGVFQAPDQFFFDNVPNSDPITINVTAGPATGTTSTIFLGPCTGGTGGASESTPASAGCADGIITGSLPTAGACGPSGLLIKSLPDMTPVSNYTINAEGTGFTATVPPGEYEITGSTDNGTTYPCFVSPYTVTVEVEGEMSASVNIDTQPSGLGCPNGIANITIHPNTGCVVGAFLTIMTNGSYNTLGTFAYDGTTPIIAQIGNLTPGDHTINISLIGQYGPWVVSNHPITIGNSGEFLEQQQYVKDEDGDNHYTEVPVSYCTPPEGWVLLTESMVYGDCAPENQLYHSNLDYVEDEDGDGYYTTGPISFCEPMEGFVLYIQTEMFLGDCAPNDPLYHNSMILYVMDADEDNHYTGIPHSACIPNLGEVPYNMEIHIEGDCYDLNTSVWEEQLYVLDADMDNHYLGAPTMMCVPSDGFRLFSNELIAGDCNDNPDQNGQLVYQDTTFVIDADHDGYYVTGSNLFGCIPLSGYVVLNSSMHEGDCDDDNASINVPVAYVLDEDGDTYYQGTPENYCQGEVPNGWVVLNGQQPGDCNDNPDNNGSIQHPGHVGTGMDIDNNCDGSVLLSEIYVDVDFNNDGEIDATDNALLHSHYGCIVAQNSDCAMYDLDGDGEIGHNDSFIFIALFAGN